MEYIIGFIAIAIPVTISIILIHKHVNRKIEDNSLCEYKCEAPPVEKDHRVIKMKKQHHITKIENMSDLFANCTTFKDE